LDAGVERPVRIGRSVFRARLAVTAIFCLFGVNIGMWASHIPVIKERLDLNPAILGLALLGAAIGSIVSQASLGLVMARTGSRGPAALSAILAIIVMPVVILSPAPLFLFCLTPVIGALWGGMNVSMNTQASEIEQARGKPTMSTFHAGASLGMLAGATFGGFLIDRGWGNGTGAIGVAVISLVVAAIAIPNLLQSRPAARARALVMPSRALLGLGLLAFLMFVIEGGVADWSALFLTAEKNASPGWAAAGFALFTGAMAVFRIFGNSVVGALGRRNTATLGGALVATGIFFAILVPWPLTSAAGFALAGIGAANIVPILISTAANTPGMAPSIGVGAVTTLGLIGFLSGPPVIGFVANAFGLSVGLSLLGLAGLVVAVAAAVRTWQPAVS